MKKMGWLLVVGVVVLAACAPAVSGPKIAAESVWGPYVAQDRRRGRVLCDHQE